MAVNVQVLDEKGMPVFCTVAAVRTSDQTILNLYQTDSEGVARIIEAGTWYPRPMVSLNYKSRIKMIILNDQDSMNADYVVDAAGGGTHLTLHGSTGALAAAIATGTNKFIWVCASHTETRTAIDTLGAMATGQRITVATGGRGRGTITYHYSGGAVGIASGTGSTLRFENMRFLRDGGFTGPYVLGSGGVGLPAVEFKGIDWDISSGARWLTALDMTGSGSATSGGLVVEDCVNTLESFAKLSSQAAATGPCRIRGNHLSMVNGFIRAASTDFEVGNSYDINDNVCTFSSYFLQRTYNFRTSIRDNTFTHSGAQDFIDLGTGATTNVTDVVIDGNNYEATAVGARFVDISPAAGTGSNIAIMGNALNGPGSGTAINVSVALADSVILNAYRDWTTNVGGVGAPGTGGDHGSQSGLSDDDHTIYALLLGRSGGQTLIGGTATGNDLFLRSNSFATPGDGSIFFEDLSFGVEIASGNPRIFFETSATRLSYDRTNNKWVWVTGNNEVLEIDGSSSTVTIFGKRAVSSSADQQFRYEFPDTTTGDALMRFLRTTNTTGDAVFSIFKGDGTNAVSFEVQRDAGASTVHGRLAGYLDLDEITAPATPAANLIRLYAKEDADTITKLWYKRPDGTEIGPLGSGSGGGHTIHDEVAAALTARTPLHFMGKGVMALDNATDTRTEIIIPTVYDAVVDNADTNAVGKSNVYATIQAAITAGHAVIWVRNANDATDITVAALDSVTHIIGLSTATTTCPVNVKVNKIGVQVQNLKFDGKWLWFNAISCISFANLFTGNVPNPQVLLNDADGIIETDTSIAFDTPTNGGLEDEGYGLIGGREWFAWTSAAATPLTANRRGDNETFAEPVWPDNTTIQQFIGHLRISAAECSVIANQWAGCTNELQVGMLIEAGGDGTTISIPRFFGNTLWCAIALAPGSTDTSACRSVAVSSGGGSTNTFTSGIIESWPKNDSNGVADGIRYFTMNGSTWRNIDVCALRIYGGAWNISGNTFDGTASNSQVLTFQRDGGSYSGAASAVTTGTATATDPSTLTVSGTPWSVNAFTDFIVRTNDGKLARILSNTSSVLTVQGWVGGTPSATATFKIIPDYNLSYTIAGTGTLAKKGVMLVASEWICWNKADSTTDTGTSTGITTPAAGTLPTMTDSGKAWTTDQWKGHVVEINGRSGMVVSNTATVLTVDAWIGGSPASPNTYNIRAALLGCSRGFNGTSAAAIADGATGNNRSQQVTKTAHGNAVVANLVNVHGGNTILDMVQPVFQFVNNSQFCVGCLHTSISVPPILMQSNVLVTAANYLIGPRFVMGINVLLGGGPTFDCQNQASLSFYPMNNAGITFTNAPNSLLSFLLAGSPTGLLSANMLPDGKNITFARTAGDRAPGCNVYINRTGATATVGFLARMSNANDHSWVLPGTGAAVSCLGVVMNAAADTADTLIATVPGTVVDIECDTVAVAQRDFIGNSLITNGRGTSLGAAPVFGQVIAQAQQAKAGGANGLVRCVLVRM